LQGCGPKGKPKSDGKCKRMNPHTPKELSLWELESQWIPEFSESDHKGQNPMDYEVP